MRSDPAFFQHQNTLNLIDDIAQSSELAIFAGAGVTVTRTGLDWNGMVEALVPDELRNFVVGQHLTELFRESQAATVLVEMYKSLAESDLLAGRLLRSELRHLLYRSGDWLAGPLTSRIASLVTARDTVVQYSAILTTNYDTHLERSITALRRRISRAPEVALRRWTRTARPEDALGGHTRGQIVLEGAPLGIDMIYLHGFLDDLDEGEVSESRTEDGTRRSNFENALAPNELDPVLAEDNFVRSAADTERMIAAALRAMPMLFLGSSMVDQPVLRSLLSSMRPGNDGTTMVAPFRRWALLPLQSTEGKLPRDEDRREYVRLQRLRLRHFGVEAIFPDFYGQVPQLVEEVTLATHLQPGAYSAPGYQGTYGHRLSSWWGAWSRDLNNEAAFKRLQSDHHSLLTEKLRSIREALMSDSTLERLKLEVWIRWAPGASSRTLRLWASSVGSLADQSVMRAGEVDARSDYVAIQTFCHGRPMLLGNKNPRSRWSRYLSQPIYQVVHRPDLSPAVGRATFPVGVIALASDSSDEEVCTLSRWNQGAHANVLKLMRDVADVIAKPEL